MYPRQRYKQGEIASPGQKYCLDCNAVYRNSDIVGEICPECRNKILDKIIVYDRTTKRGKIPTNLRKYVDG